MLLAPWSGRMLAVLQKRYFMMCNDWFKGACERKLEPGKVPENGICTYRVVVTTSDMRGAGTDADVTMQVRTCGCTITGTGVKQGTPVCAPCALHCRSDGIMCASVHGPKVCGCGGVTIQLWITHSRHACVLWPYLRSCLVTRATRASRSLTTPPTSKQPAGFR